MFIRNYCLAFCLLAPQFALASCWEYAGQRYDIDPLLLYAIAQQESSLNPAAINRNRDGSTDIGLMQINSRHLPRLKTHGIDRQRLLTDPCTSVLTGAWILAEAVQIFGYTWEAVGAYNAGGAAGRQGLRKAYAQKIWRRYQRLLEQPQMWPAQLKTGDSACRGSCPAAQAPRPGGGKSSKRSGASQVPK